MKNAHVHLVFTLFRGRGIRRSRRCGLTLLEVLLVIAILGAIAAMVVPQLLGRQQEAMIKVTKSSIKGMEDAAKLYAVDHDGEYPRGNGDAVYPIMLDPKDARGNPIKPYLDEIPKDAWGTPLFYEYPPSNKTPPGGKPAIWSAGPNRQNENGQGDDVANWSSRDG